MNLPVAPSLDELGRDPWDAIVIGAGPAGGMAAHQLARSGLRTLLLDAKAFPRPKVCGGCLNRRAIAVLAASHLSHVLADCSPLPLDEFQVTVRGRRTRFPLPEGASICRAEFDSKLALAAAAAGATFAPGIVAIVESDSSDDVRYVTASDGSRRELLRARIVICADGLTRTSLRRLPEFEAQVALSSRIGFGAIVSATFVSCGDRAIEMVVTDHGYVGLAKLAGDRVSVAAAIDGAELAHQQPGAVAVEWLRAAGYCVDPELTCAEWHGTPPLTNRPSRVAAERLFLIGDAGGYVEPFTGEGIAAALESAAAVAPLAVAAIANWNQSLAAEWEATHRRIVRSKQLTVRALAWVLRRPAAAGAVLAAGSAFPAAARAVISRINQAPSGALIPR